VLGSWKSQLVLNAHIVFESGSSDASKEQRIAELERLLGKQALELETAKKALWLADVQRQKGDCDGAGPELHNCGVPGSGI
jgi:hypothetical protein